MVSRKIRERIRPRAILVPGYAGDLTPEELTYIKAELKASARLRKLWGFRTTRISEAMIKKVALDSMDQGQNSTEAHHTPSEMKLRQKRKMKR